MNIGKKTIAWIDKHLLGEADERVIVHILEREDKTLRRNRCEYTPPMQSRLQLLRPIIGFGTTISGTFIARSNPNPMEERNSEDPLVLQYLKSRNIGIVLNSDEKNIQ